MEYNGEELYPIMIDYEKDWFFIRYHFQQIYIYTFWGILCRIFGIWNRIGTLYGIGVKEQFQDVQKVPYYQVWLYIC